MDWLTRFLEALWTLLVESGFWLLVGFLMAGAVHALVPKGWLARQLGRPPSGSGVLSRLWPIAKASLLGIPLPLCSCSVIPVAAGLRREGASKGSSAAFAISTPQTGEESIPLTWALFGPVFALSRPLIAVATALAAGLSIEALTKEDTGDRPSKAGDEHSGKSCCSSKDVGLPIQGQTKNEVKSQVEPASCCSSASAPAQSSCCSTAPAASAPASCCASEQTGEETRSLGERVLAGLRHGFVTMPVDLAPWLVGGLVLAALVSALVPQDWIAQNLGTGIVPMLLMLIVGVPLYICATSSTPLAYSLVAAGLSPGAALVLLLTGPATNVATMAWVVKDLGVRALVIYLSVISIVAVATGWAFDAFLSGMVTLAEGGQAHEHAGTGGLWSMTLTISAVLLVALMLVALGARIAQIAKRKQAGAHEHANAAPACH